jgi:hypothetical protein
MGLRLCRGDPILGLLRDVFDATPLRVPEERVTPLSVAAVRGGDARFLGGISPLLDDGTELALESVESRVASLSAKRSQAVKLDLGLQVLDGFLTGLGIPTPRVSVLLKGARDISFVLDEVNRSYVEVTLLGKAIAGRKLDRANLVAAMFTGGHYEFLVIDSVLRSRGFSVETGQERAGGFEVNAETLADLVGSVKAGSSVTTTTGRELHFAGPGALTFAFSCVRFVILDDGRIAAIEPGEAPSTLGLGPDAAVLATPNRVVLTREPELLDWS